VLIDNDVNIMALGERQTAFPRVEDLVFVKVATGIGAGLISGGTLQRGARGTAGDLGHARVPGADDVTCRCGNTGCLEAVAAGPAVAQALRRAGVAAATPQDVVDLVRAGDLTAIQVVRQAGRDIGDVLATLVNLVNPAVVVIGGRMAGAGEHLLAGIREVVYRRSMPLATEHLQIVASVAGGGAALDGAVAMAVAHVLSPEQIERALRSLTAS
jgi:predicted NBD/HSP70 family sugar kinase